MKTKFLIFNYIICITSCSSLDFFGYQKLGNHYFLWEGDHYKYSIIWTPDDSHAKIGGTLVIGNVVKYNYNEIFVVAKSTEYETAKDSINRFWIIDKSKSLDSSKNNWNDVIIGPLDSVDLIKRMRQNKIELKLKDVPLH